MVCLNELWVYEKHDSVWTMISVVWFLEVNVMKMVIMWKVLSDVLTHTTNEWKNEVNEWKWGIIGLKHFLSTDKVSRPFPTIPKKH